MKRTRFTEEQIIGVLREQEAGAKTSEVCRKHGVSEPTFHKWKAKYGGIEVSEARRLTMPEFVLFPRGTAPFARILPLQQITLTVIASR